MSSLYYSYLTIFILLGFFRNVNEKQLLPRLPAVPAKCLIKNGLLKPDFPFSVEKSENAQQRAQKKYV